MSNIRTCGACELSWDDSIITSMTPAPSARCPFEYFHEYGEDGEPTPLAPDAIPNAFEVQVFLEREPWEQREEDDARATLQEITDYLFPNGEWKRPENDELFLLDLMARMLEGEQRFYSSDVRTLEFAVSHIEVSLKEAS